MTELFYKFYPAHWGRDALYRERFKLTTLKDINDPFEFLATSTDKGLRNAARNLRSTEFAKEGVISFSRTWQEPLLWSHYAQNHKGIALGFELRNPKHKYEIVYSDQRVVLPIPKTKEFGDLARFWEKIRVTKSKNWSYEQEVRVFASLKGSVFENGIYFRPFDDLGQLRKIILGPKYDPINDDELQNRLASNSVDVVSSRLGFRHFRVEKQKSKKLQKVV